MASSLLWRIVLRIFLFAPRKGHSKLFKDIESKIYSFYILNFFIGYLKDVEYAPAE